MEVKDKKEINLFLRLRSDFSAVNETILFYVEAGLPDVHKGNNPEFVRGNIIKAILADKITVWTAMRQEEKDVQLCAVFTTMFSFNPLTDDKILIIFSQAAVRGMTPSLYRDGLVELKKYANKNGVDKIIFQTSDTRLSNIATKMGASIMTTISFGGI